MPEGEDGRLRSRAERGCVHIMASTDESDGFGNTVGYFGFGWAVIDHDERSANNQIVGDIGKQSRWIEQTQGQAPGEERFGRDERIPGRNEVGRLVILAIVCDDILGMGQVLNMSLCVINATSPVTIETMPVHFRSDKLRRVEKSLKRSGVGEIRAAHIADLAIFGNSPF
jgi:hypothetical protein